MSESLLQIDDGKARLGAEVHGSEQEDALFPWSASRLKALLQCPRQFRFAYIDGLPTIVTAPLAFGRAVHDTLKCAHEAQMVKGQLPPVGELIGRFDALWNEALQGEVLFRPSHPTPSRYGTTGHEMLRLFHAQNRDAMPPLMVELPFEVAIDHRGGTFRLRGIIDRVDEVALPSGEVALVVIDYKSGSRKMKGDEVRGDLQLTIYALAVRQMLGRAVERVELHLLRDGQALSSPRDESDFAAVLGEVLPLASRTLEQGEFTPRPGDWCRWCDFQGPCQEEGGVPNGLCR